MSRTVRSTCSRPDRRGALRSLRRRRRPVGRGRIAGIVRDASGAAIPGATVHIVNEETGTRDVVSDGQGAYRTAALGPGAYSRRDRARRLRGGRAAGRARGRPDAAVDVTLSPRASPSRSSSPRGASRKSRRKCRSRCRSSAATLVANTGAFNVNRLKELIPTVQFYSTNPRNSAINIRGLGAPFGLTNDGLEPASASTSTACSTRGRRRRRSTSSTSSGSKCCAVRRARCSARTRRPARSTSRRGSRASRRRPIRAQLRRPRVRAGQGLGDRPDRPEGRGTGVVLGHAARRQGLQRRAPRPTSTT